LKFWIKPEICTNFTFGTSKISSQIFKREWKFFNVLTANALALVFMFIIVWSGLSLGLVQAPWPVDSYAHKKILYQKSNEMCKFKDDSVAISSPLNRCQ
jgi:hypothetical protein